LTTKALTHPRCPLFFSVTSSLLLALAFLALGFLALALLGLTSDKLIRHILGGAVFGAQVTVILLDVPGGLLLALSLLSFTFLSLAFLGVTGLKVVGHIVGGVVFGAQVRGVIILLNITGGLLLALALSLLALLALAFFGIAGLKIVRCISGGVIFGAQVGGIFILLIITGSFLLAFALSLLALLAFALLGFTRDKVIWCVFGGVGFGAQVGGIVLLDVSGGLLLPLALALLALLSFALLGLAGNELIIVGARCVGVGNIANEIGNLITLAEVFEVHATSLRGEKAGKSPDTFDILVADQYAAIARKRMLMLEWLTT
jgi:hypothetical protein